MRAELKELFLDAQDYLAKGKKALALKLYNQALTLAKKDTEEEFFANTFIGMCHDDFGEYEKSIKYFKKSQSLAKFLWGARSFELAGAINNEAMARKQLDEEDEAAKLFLQAVSILREVQLKEPKSPAKSDDQSIATTVEMLANAGEAKLCRFELESATELFREGYEFASLHLSSTHPRRIQAALELACLEFAKANNNSALELMVEAIPAQAVSAVSSVTILAETIARMSSLLDHLGIIDAQELLATFTMGMSLGSRGIARLQNTSSSKSKGEKITSETKSVSNKTEKNRASNVIPLFGDTKVVSKPSTRSKSSSSSKLKPTASKTANLKEAHTKAKNLNVAEKSKNKSGYQLKIWLRGVKPEIWRRITVSKECSFAELHKLIQKAMGWEDSHLHHFIVDGSIIGNKKQLDDCKDERKINLEDLELREGSMFDYGYDFGDDWRHTVKVESEVDDISELPTFVDGRRACPPEDCGGPRGFMKLLEILNRPDERKHLPEFFDDYDPDEIPNCFKQAKKKSGTRSTRASKPEK